MTVNTWPLVIVLVITSVGGLVVGYLMGGAQ
jgi:hypothetical protein